MRFSADVIYKSLVVVLIGRRTRGIIGRLSILIVTMVFLGSDHFNTYLYSIAFERYTVKYPTSEFFCMTLTSLCLERLFSTDIPLYY